MDTSENPGLYRQKIRQIYRHMPVGVASTLINSLALTFVLWGVIPAVTLTLWLTACVLVSAFRTITYLHFSRPLPEPQFRKQVMLFDVSLGVSGLVWGSAGIFLFSPESIPHQSFVAFVLGGMVAGAAGTLSVLLRSFLVFSLPALTPVIVRLLAMGDPIHVAMGGMTLLFGILMYRTARCVNAAVSSSLQLQFENRDLVRRLEHRVKERTFDLEETNEKLKEEVDKRNEAEKALLLLNDELDQRIRARTAELERKTQELQEFAFVASHDLAEPLRKVQTFGSLLTRKATTLSEEGKDYISRMTGAASRMQELLDALLRYSRVETKGEAFRPARLDDVAKGAAGDLEIALQEAEAEVRVAPMQAIRCDPNQMRQLFQNLIANAVKYRHPEGDTVINIYGEGNEKDYRVFVEDNGIGFDEKYLERIFQPFQRLHGRSEFPGTGMGLAICRKIVERHMGTITAKSIPGKGSTFIVTLPADKHSPEP